MTKRKAWSLRFWIPMVALAAALAYSSCGGEEINLFKPVAKPMALKHSDKAKLEESRVLMDKHKYSESAAVVEPMIQDEKHDSNDARLLYAAAKLGESGMDVWSLIRTILSEESQSGKSSSGGLDVLINSMTDSLLGTGLERQMKVDALSAAITALRGAPDPKARAIANTTCLFAAILAVPTVADAKSGLTATLAALQQIKTQATSGGVECPNIALLDQASASVVSAAANFSLVLTTAKSCPFLDLGEAQALMNQVQAQLSNLKAKADLGCAALPACPATIPDCGSLFPACVQEALTVGTSHAVAGDGEIAACELVLNCSLGNDCFSK